MADRAYHIPHGTEANKTVCGRPIEVGGRPQVLLTTNAEKRKGTVCGRCKALKAGQARTEKVAAKHRKIREASEPGKKAAPVQMKEHKGRTPGLAPYVDKIADGHLEAKYKGAIATAMVQSDGQITVHGETFNSPSRAGKRITGREVDGWLFWSFRATDGSLKKLNTLREHNEEGN